MDVVYSSVFRGWFKRLRDRRGRVAIAARIRRIEQGNFGDHRSVGGVSELRIDVGRGYRVYCTIRQRTAVILLCGGDKARQQQDIQRAQRMARET